MHKKNGVTYMKVKLETYKSLRRGILQRFTGNANARARARSEMLNLLKLLESPSTNNQRSFYNLSKAVQRHIYALERIDEDTRRRLRRMQGQLESMRI